ncbi:hypothetical protein CGZ93_10825 [Enemella dayhoffiae]|uniref:DNA methylase N-4/N-6 domain-containing protein n=1 Tax=Enemella dayhoffiae TaxID=2016507 RepID=A0A255H3M1_9ACTN|nr:hypothetical protein CGZ93_10825 [Enemella dayhoffiae]
MYPRLELAKELLAEDGVIFVSIDDNEQANLKILCDEIFGEQNFIAGFIVVRSEGVGWRSKLSMDMITSPPIAERREVQSIGSPQDIRGSVVSMPLGLRWIQLHVLREHAQHCGHADILREQVLARR